MRLADRPRTTAVCVALLAVGVAIAFAPVVEFGWVFDDQRQIVENRTITAWSGIPRAFGTTLWSFDPAMPDDPRRSYRPLFVLYLVLARKLFGLDPAGWHVTSVLLHMCASAVVWRTIASLGASRSVAAASAVVFAVHPIQIQAAVWISAVTDPLYVIAFGLGLQAWAIALRPGAPRWAALAAGAGLGVAMLMLERAFVAVGVFALVAAVWPSGFDRVELRRRAALLLAPLLAVAVVVGLRVHATADATDNRAIGLLEAVWTAPSLAMEYGRQLLFPFPLALGYPLGVVPSFSVTAFVIPFVVVLAALAGAWRLSRSSALRRLLLLSTLILLLPALDAQLLHPLQLVQDRYLYAPSMFAFAWASDVVLGLRARSAPWLALAWLVLLIALHRPNLEPWRDALTLYTRAQEVAPGHPTYAVNLSNERRRRGLDDPDCGLLHAARAALDSPSWPGSIAPVEYNLGNCWRDAGDPRRAITHFRAAVEASDGQLFRALYNLAGLQLELGDLVGARASAEQLRARHSQLGASWRMIGVIAARSGGPDEARAAFERALELDPSDDASREMLARLPSG